VRILALRVRMCRSENQRERDDKLAPLRFPLNLLGYCASSSKELLDMLLQEAPVSGGDANRSLPFRAKLLRLMGRLAWKPRGYNKMLRAILPPGRKSVLYVTDFFGFRYPGDLVRDIDWAVFAYGCYAPAELTLLAALSSELRGQRQRLVFFDVGANVGHHTLFMSAHADVVFAFEPFSPLIEKIREKIVVNQLTNVRIIPFGLGDADGNLTYFLGSESQPGMGSFVFEGVRLQHNTEAINLGVRRGDAISSELALPPIDILKIDVDGFEPQVLRGFQKRIRSDRPAVLMEMTDLSRNGFQSERGFCDCFWEGASFAESLRAPEGNIASCPFVSAVPVHPVRSSLYLRRWPIS
jgi:FkbM family methyltransferase